MGEITFIRHGQASFGRGNYDVLSEKGKEQSILLARHIMECGNLYDSAYCGTLERQKDTADIMLGEMAASGQVNIPRLTQLEGLNEYQSEEIMKYYVPIVAAENKDMMPVVEKMFTDKRSFQLVFERVMARWLAGESPSAGVEGWMDFRRRVDESVKKIISENEKEGMVLVVSSGGAISACVHIATGMSPSEAIRLGWGLVNSSVTKFRYGSSGLILHSFNCYAHLEQGKTKDLITYR